MFRNTSTRIFTAIALSATGVFAVASFVIAQTITNVNQNQMPPNPNQPPPTQTIATSGQGGVITNPSGTEETLPSAGTESRPPTPDEKSAPVPTNDTGPSGDGQRTPSTATAALNESETKPEGRLESLPLSIYLILAAFLVLALLFLKWLRKFLKKHKTEPQLPSEQDEKPCPTCGGKGTITKRRTISTPCGHCKQTGRDICHHCGGSGHYGGGLTVPQTQDDVDSLMKCDYCEGKGFSSPPIACCMCKGARKEYAEESYEDTCPDCKGTGHKAK